MSKNRLEDFISRELSWLDFNSRVLDEAGTAANPVLERLKFIAITGGNLDEFFMVRIAGLRQLVLAGRDLPDPAGLRPSEQLALAREKIERMIKRQSRYLLDQILPELAEQQIFLQPIEKLPASCQNWLHNYFCEEISPVLTPLIVDAAHPFPRLNSGALEVAATLEIGGNDAVHAFVEIPQVLCRFIEVPNAHGTAFILLEDLVAANLRELFPGCTPVETICCRITRDMDFSVEDDNVDDLLSCIDKKLDQRRRRSPVRLEVAGINPKGNLVNWLLEKLELERDFCYFSRAPLNLKQFFELSALVNRPELQAAVLAPVMAPELTGNRNVFEAISEHGNIMLALPFHSFEPVVRLLNQAAEDPDVLAIKQTLYRVSGNSPVVKALQKAAENGKQVTVVVELKARFDERNNIAWAKLLDESGAHVVYGIAGLKVHSKALLIIRREEGMIRRYVHLSTGNYNDKTAAMYTDIGLLSCDPELSFDVSNLFNVLTGYSAAPPCWNMLAVSPFNLRSRIEWLIRREIANAQEGRPAGIIAKMNSFSDEQMVNLIHEAADAGVKIDLIVRGICCYRPLPRQKNVRIISIVDRYLEHTRLFCFCNGGNEECFLSSADWMTRNLDRRIETMFPVPAGKIKETLRTMLEYQLNDTDKLRRLLPQGIYTRPRKQEYGPNRSQNRRYELLKSIAGRELRGESGNPLKIFTSRNRSQFQK